MITEREWRRQNSRRRRLPASCRGAQCVVEKKHALHQDRAFRAFMLILSAIAALYISLAAAPEHQEAFDDVSLNSEETASPRRVQAVSYVIPAQLQTTAHTYTIDQLMRGKMLLIDDEHPLPEEAPPPNTMSIALAGKGMVPVRSLQIRSGTGTIQALTELFAALRQQGVSGLTVWEGTLSAAQQQAQKEAHARRLMQTMPPDEAVRLTHERFDVPGTGELLQEYAVELRFQTDETDAADERPLESTPDGQKLLQTAWRYGFVRSRPTAQGRHAFRFRWVGKAHATAMTYLDLSLEEYLQWLHSKEVLTIEEKGEIRYVILCKAMKGTHIAFNVPVNAKYEASLDNMGYAIVACEIPKE